MHDIVSITHASLLTSSEHELHRYHHSRNADTIRENTIIGFRVEVRAVLAVVSSFIPW